MEKIGITSISWFRIFCVLSVFLVQSDAFGFLLTERHHEFDPNRCSTRSLFKVLRNVGALTPAQSQGIVSRFEELGNSEAPSGIKQVSTELQELLSATRIMPEPIFEEIATAAIRQAKKN